MILEAFSNPNNSMIPCLCAEVTVDKGRVGPWEVLAMDGASPVYSWCSRGAQQSRHNTINSQPPSFLSIPKPHGSPHRCLVALIRIFIFNRDRRWAPEELIHHLGLGECEENFFLERHLLCNTPALNVGTGSPRTSAGY